MSYATTARRPNPLAALGAMGVPATFGAILVLGLAVKQVIVPPVPNPEATDIPDVVITPEIVESDLPPSPANTQSKREPEFTNTRPESDFEFELGSSGPIGTFDGIDTGTTLGTEISDFVLPPIEPMLDPVRASPRGNPGNWIMTSDYRSSWIRRELTGTARFTLEVDARGKVSSCTITGSTGHTELDRATCNLIQERAVFNPAKGSDGEATAGTFSSSVNWTIPD
ncbi:TonB family protein [uncultured Erythrobacter sp.]|uniref:TonB family protein n=1 Tax=uncultured Erythrobacter sp. TaxID=263913 RepID=UPI002625E90C|nr:TonB family protein [uncultured Erythrobacter sp.]